MSTTVAREPGDGGPLSDAIVRPKDGTDLVALGTVPVVLFTNSMVMGGMEEHVLQLGRGLRERGHRVAVICGSEDAIKPLREALVAADVDVHALISRRASPIGAVPRIAELARIMRAYRHGILHLHFTGHRGGDLAAIAARVAGLSAVVRSVHLPPVEPASRRERALVRIRDRQLARIICVSEQTKREHLDVLGRDPKKCVVVHNGVDLVRFSPDVSPVDVRAEFGFDPAAPIVGTVARLGEARKGIDRFVAAAAIVAERRADARFLIVGEGDLRPELERQARALGVAPKIVFTGHRGDVPALLRAMRVFASPSIYEACQYNLLEAMAAGLPCVSTPTGVAPEVIRDGTTGRLVPIGDSAALAGAIVELIDEPARASVMGRGARELIAKRFSVDAMLEGIVRVYREVA